MLVDGVTWGDAREWLPALPDSSVDLFFTSPPYADARSYSRIHPDRYVEWFLPFARAMLRATAEDGSFVLNIKNRVAKSGPLRGQRHPYVYELVLALRHIGWRWIETYVWAKPNSVPGRFGPRTKDAFEYVYHFAKGKPYFDLDAIRVPYKTPENEIERRRLDRNGRRKTAAKFGRDRAQTYNKGGRGSGQRPSRPADVHSKLDKSDTRDGWAGVGRDARDGVPYWTLLYQRYVGGVWRQVQDAYSEVKGDAVLERPLTALLERERIPFHHSGRGASAATETAQLFGINPGPDFLLPDLSPTVVVESKVVEDGGSARDKAARIRSLAQAASQRGLVPCAVIDGKGWRERPAALVEVIIATGGRTFSLNTLEYLLGVPEIDALRGTAA